MMYLLSFKAKHDQTLGSIKEYPHSAMRALNHTQYVVNRKW